MPSYTAYDLTFKTALHLGRYTGPAQTGQLGLEKTEVYIPADTLFSALCQTWTTFYGSTALETFLNRYQTDMPFRLTSAFPFAGDVRFFPKPLIPLEVADAKDYKKVKKVQFVSQKIFEILLSETPPEFNGDFLVNGGTMWVAPEEQEELKKLLNGETEQDSSADNDITVWKIDRRPRVTLDRETHASQIWHLETLQFNKKCGLWFATQFRGDDQEDIKTEIDTLLNVLGDAGIGGERNAGYGLFEFKEKSVEIDTAGGSNRFVTLAPLCPKGEAELKVLISGDVSYNLTTCGGWGNSTGTPFRRQTVMMFSEGSVLTTTKEESGHLVPLQPTQSGACTHSVYRYGYAWPVGIKGGQP